VWLTGVDEEQQHLHVETRDVLLEAPNWSLDGSALFANGAGKLWRIPLDGRALTEVPIADVPNINNDHVLAPDGRTIYLSANDWNLYHALLDGGSARRITTSPPIDGLMHFLHGVSPDGSRLAFIGLEPDGGNWPAKANVFTVRIDGTDYQQLTFGSAPADGCEYSPAGDWIYFNTEAFDGHAQIARIRPDGTELEQLTFDDKVNWFPHLAPIGPYACYVAFPPGTAGHPPDVWVDLMLVEGGRWSEARPVAHVYGGQGTINVNSWSPDGRRFAYVSHDRDEP
jgi:Tol biopolymer transport system component